MGRSTLPFSWYRDPDLHAREQARIFGRRWQYAGHLGQVAAPGSAAPTRAGDVPVLLVRDADATLRAFVNVCRHRGTRLVAEAARCAVIRCPYHAWTYGLDGTLRSAPRSQAEPEFRADELSLVPVAVDRWGPFVFVNPDPTAEPLVETLGDLPEQVASAGVDVDTLVFHERVPGSYAANWKICCENFQECYHCQVAHPGFAKVIDTSAEGYRLVEGRWHSSQFGTVKERWTGDFDPMGTVATGQFHFLYPNCTINIAPGSPNISIGPILPEDPERTSRYQDYFFAPGTDPEWIAGLMSWDDRVGREDTALVQGVQQGVRAGMPERGVLFDSERLIAHFDRLVRDDVG